MFRRTLSSLNKYLQHYIYFNTAVRHHTTMTSDGSWKEQNLQSKNCEDALVWIDLELTDLDLDTSTILEVACLISDKDLNIIGDSLHIVIHQPDSVLDNMNEWCINMHNKTNLTQACRESKISIADGEQLLLAHLKKYTSRKKCFMSGNSVYMDYIFVNKYMPLVHDYLHYRLIDVSTIKELARMWKPDVYLSAPRKVQEHRALADIKETINEFRHYKKFLFP